MGGVACLLVCSAHPPAQPWDPVWPGIPKQASERYVVSTFQRLACLFVLTDDRLAWDPSGLGNETSWLETL